MAIVKRDAELPNIDYSKFGSIGIGPGLGKEKDAFDLFTGVLSHCKKPVVIDADALNLLAAHHGLWDKMPKGSILTPHMKEFDRLFGEHKSWWQRIQTGIAKAKRHQICILLKNDYTLVITPQGKVYFNPTGNPAMATGGMGDVLTGVITSLLAQKYTPEEACIIGAYIHGKAGDELALPNRMNVVTPSALAARLPYTMAKLMA
jgi:NAD(P)H-hydrate epimerase